VISPSGSYGHRSGLRRQEYIFDIILNFDGPGNGYKSAESQKEVSAMFSEYIQAALARAEREPIEVGEYCATVPGLRGVIATGKTIEECRKDLIEVLEGWISFRLRLGMPIPPLGGKTIEVSAEPEDH
jgi:predicted RNase H-like HicB family nuclease